jgi:hypothetical protein
MAIRNYIAAVLLTLSVNAAEPAMPQLRVEPTTGGSIFYVRNISTQPLTAFLLELVNYPGSSYTFLQDYAASDPIAPGVERTFPVTNMTVGAVPDYVKMQAAVYADGATTGLPEKVAQIIQRRRSTLQTTRELIQHLEKAQAAGTSKSAILVDLRQWADSIQPAGKANRNSQAAIIQAAAKSRIMEIVTNLDTKSVEESLAILRSSERMLAASKPAF